MHLGHGKFYYIKGREGSKVKMRIAWTGYAIGPVIPLLRLKDINRRIPLS